MTWLRTWAMSVACVAALAACAAPSAQDAQPGDAPASAATARRAMTTGGPLPPRVQDLSCHVDADCTAKRHCAGAECRCIDGKCIALRDPVDPVIDPAPATSVR